MDAQVSLNIIASEKDKLLISQTNTLFDNNIGVFEGCEECL